jgi:DNA-binding transcriptional MerR regulator
VVNDWLSIGELAHASGLNVSALRWYDGAGVLVPAAVDPSSGYRRYGPGQVADARLVAALRRVGMHVADIAAVMRADHAGAAHAVLERHLTRLRDGLALARRELARAHDLIDSSLTDTVPTEPPPTHQLEDALTTLTLSAPDLAAAVDRVRFAADADHDVPALRGLLLEAYGDLVRLVATDRYRLAMATIAGAVSPEGTVEVALPIAFVDELRPLLADGDVTIVVAGEQVTARTSRGDLTGQAAGADFPDYRRVMPVAAAHRFPVDVSTFRATLSNAARRRVSHRRRPVDVVVLGVDDAGELTVGGTGTRLEAGFNPEFLLEAITAAGATQLLLDLDGPLRPLAIRLPSDESCASLLMPIALPDRLLRSTSDDHGVVAP